MCAFCTVLAGICTCAFGSTLASIARAISAQCLQTYARAISAQHLHVPHVVSKHRMPACERRFPPPSLTCHLIHIYKQARRAYGTMFPYAQRAILFTYTNHSAHGFCHGTCRARYRAPDAVTLTSEPMCVMATGMRSSNARQRQLSGSRSQCDCAHQRRLSNASCRMHSNMPISTPA